MTDEGTAERPVTSGEVVSAPDVTGEWLPPATAASRLGVSERTLWREVKAGRYHRRIVDRKALILVPDSSATPNEGATGLAVAPDTGASLAALVEMERRLSRQANTVTRQAVQITRLTERLEARAESLEWTQAQLDQARAELEAMRARAALPWWRRLW